MPTSPASSAFRFADGVAAPPCPECAEALRPVGGGQHRYWSCRWCGTTMPRH